MGKWIDRAVLTALTAFILYLLFVSAFGNIFIACCLTFICCALLYQYKRQRGGKFTMTKFQAQSILENWAYGQDEDAKAQIESLTHHDGMLVYLPKHPTATLSMGDVFSAWKKHRDSERIIVAAVCHSDGRARTFASTLQNPTVEILDAARLIPLVRKSDLRPPDTPRIKQIIQKVRTLLADLPYRRSWRRNLFSGLGLMLIYLFAGSAGYLALSIGMLFISGVGLRRRA